jgi:hypothetical protein
MVGSRNDIPAMAVSTSLNLLRANSGVKPR